MRILMMKCGDITIDRAPVYLKLNALPAKSLAVSLTPEVKAAAQ
jgi:hypothetical protein